MGASSLVRVLCQSMNWEDDYSYRIPCQMVREPGGDRTVLVFDLDNYIGRAINKKEEIVIARKAEEAAEKQDENGKSFFFPPDKDEPQEIREMEERFQKIRERNRKIFGEPVFAHTGSMRGFDWQEESGGEWEMMAEARPLDIDHRVSGDTVDSLLKEIIDDPPKLPEGAYAEDVVEADDTDEEHEGSEKEGG